MTEFLRPHCRYLPAIAADDLVKHLLTEVRNANCQVELLAETRHDSGQVRGGSKAEVGQFERM